MLQLDDDVPCNSSELTSTDLLCSTIPCSALPYPAGVQYAESAALLWAQRQARAAKKELKVMFKDELIKQQRAMATPAPATIPLP